MILPLSNNKLINVSRLLFPVSHNFDFEQLVGHRVYVYSFSRIKLATKISRYVTKR